MDRLERYREAVQTLLEQHSQVRKRDEDVEDENIVLGLHPPYKRPYIGYGVA